MSQALKPLAQAARLVRGAGGGKGGGGGGGSEAADTVRSTQIADTVDLLGEGEIEGLTNGLQSIYFDGVPLQNADGSFNFEDVEVFFTPGTQGQASITGADGVQVEVPVSVNVVAATPVVRTISNPAVDTVRVTISVPQLSETDTGNGDIRGSSFEWAVDVQSAGGGFVELLRETVSAKTMSRYSIAKRFALPGSAPWDIRVRRVSPDSTGAYVVNAFAFSSYTEIQSVKLRHPNSAMVRTRINARQFSRMPVRSFDVMALRVPVPTNYNPMTKVYTGVWDGTFKIAWTDCPAWVFNAVVTNPRYGLGRYFASTEAMKWSLYRIGQYCDGMVSDGKGGMEPRFRCGVQLTTREQAYKVVTDLAAIFRGMAYWMDTDLAVVQDAPSDPVALYTPANVVGGKFVYGGTSHSKLPSQVTVWFNDLAQHGKLVPEVVVDRDFERRWGVRPMKDLSPLGVWSRAQARRIGRWALYSEHNEGESVAFNVGLDGVLVPPGAVFQVTDPNEAGERLGGRVRSATASAVTLDQPVTLASGEAYTLTVMLQDPASPARLVPQTRPVTTPAGAAAALAVFPAFTAAPAAQSVWMLQSDAVQATTWRCLAVKEVEGKNEFTVQALRHYPQKYALIDAGIDFEPSPVSRVAVVPPKPLNLVLMETVYRVGTAQRSRVIVSWEEPAPGLNFQVSWRLNGGTWTDVPLTSSNAVDLDGLSPGTLDVTVRSRNVLGRVSPPVMDDLVLVGNATPGIRLVTSSGVFSFDAAGVARPAAQTVVLTAQPVSLAGTVSWAATGYNAAGASLGVLTLAGTGESRSLTVGAFGVADSAVVVASLGGYSATVTVKRVQDGAAGAGLFNWIVSGACTAAGGDIEKTGGTDAWGEGGGYSVESYVNGAFASARATATNKASMFGLSDDPAADSDVSSIDYAWRFAGDGQLKIFESGVSAGSFGAFTTATVATITYDGQSIRYMKDGVVVRTVATTAARRFHLDTAFYNPGARMVGLTFGPMGAAGNAGYTWIAYADSADGSSGFTTGAWGGQTYLGIAANRPTATKSTDPADYTWSLMKGEAGLPGTPGANGVTTYTWVAYANNDTGTAGFTTGAWSGQTYLGIAVNKTTATESANPADYVWSLIKGDQGVPGTPGADGVTTYTWIAYANNSTGTSGFTTGANTGQTFIGIANNKTTPTESTNPADYTWSLIKGDQGVPGTPGADGVTTYTWFAYANNSTGTSGFTTGAWSGQTYLGIAPNKTTATESTNPADYTWSKIEGPQGPAGAAGSTGATGAAGPQGPTGPAGATLYTWIAYANNSTGTSGFTTGANTGQAYIGIANNQTSATEGTDPAAYTWSLIKGEAGVPGTPGADGATTYTWFAYANSADGTSGFTTGAWSGQTHLGIAPNKTTATESTNPADYVWSRIAGTSANWVRVTGDNLNANNAGFNGRLFELSGGYSFTPSSRGHTLSVFNPATGALVSGPTSYDTYTSTAGLVSALAAVGAGNVVALCSVDATGCDASLRSQLVALGSRDPQTWSAARVSHVFVGMKGLLPGQAYEAVSSAATAAGVLTLQAYYAASGIVLNGAEGPQGPGGASAVSYGTDRAAVVLAADSTGAVDSGLLPTTINAWAKSGPTTDTVSWSWTRTATSGISTSISGAAVTITAMSIDAGEVTIIGTRSGYSSISVTVPVTKAKRSTPNAGPTPGQALYAESATVGPADALAAVEFRTDGAIYVNETGYLSQVSSWYAPNTSGIGWDFDVRVDVLAADGLSGGYYTNCGGARTQISSTRWAHLETTENLSYRTRSLTYAIYRRSNGEQVASGTIQLATFVDM